MHKVILFIVIITIICVTSLIIQNVLELTTTPNLVDRIKIEFIKYTLNDQNNDIIHMQFEILRIVNNTIHYSISTQDTILEKQSSINDDELYKLISLITDTGFLSLSEDFQQSDIIQNDGKNVLKITLDEKKHKIVWSTNHDVDLPPIITMIEVELNTIISQLIK